MSLLSRRHPQPEVGFARAIRLLAPVSLLVLTGTLCLPVNAQVLMQPNLSVAQARQIVDTIIAECSQPGDLVTVTIAVVDRAGQPVMQLRADTASPHNYRLAYRKAYTARTFRITSIDWRDRTANGAQSEGQRSMVDVIPLGGGAPIMMGDVPIGGVGVSGSSGGQAGDSACAEAGVAAIADDLE